MSKAYRITENCVGCGLCQKACPTEAIDKSNEVYTINDRCVGCGVCEKTCRLGAIEETVVALDSVACQSCPIHCNIPKGQMGACLRYVNDGGILVRKEPLHIVDKEDIRFNHMTGLPSAPLMLGLGAGTNLYSADVPARFVGKDEIDGVDVVSAVTESVLSFSGVKVKLDTDEEIGTAGSEVRRDGKVVGYIAPTEYGSRMMYIGGAELVTGKDGFTVIRTMIQLLNKERVTVRTDDVKELVLEVGTPPVFDGKQPKKMRSGCGSMIVEGFAKKWIGLVDEVIALDFDVTALLSTHMTSGIRYGLKTSGIIPVGRYSSPGRYFGTRGNGWGGSNITNGRDAIASINRDQAWPGLKLVVTEPNAERAAYFILDDMLEPVEMPIPDEVEEVLEFIRNTCEDCSTNVSVVAGFGGGFRNVISNENPLNVNQAVKEGKVMFSVCGQPAHILPGGGITVEADIANMPDNAFAWVATPAAVVPVEVTMTSETYEEIGGYLEAVKPMEDIIRSTRTETVKIKKVIK